MKNNSHQIPRPKFLTILAALLAVACVLLYGSAAQAQSSITGIYPNGTNLFQASPTLSFTANSPAGISNVTVQLTVISLYKGTSFLKNLTAASGLTITGPSTALNVSAVLTSNTLYSAVITITDTNGSVATRTRTFDTITPTYTWEAEDWDFTSNSISGLYIDNPQTNAYAGLATTVEGSNNNGPGQYRPSVPGPSTETTGSPETPGTTPSGARLQYIGTGKTDYDVGWTDGGEFANYTRHYPAGTYNMFVRASGGNGARTRSGDIVIISGAVTGTGTTPYRYNIQGRGWQTYDFMPVIDSSGALVQFTFDGNPATLQELQNQANDNINFYMLVPLNTNEVATTVTITNVYPDGAFQFQATNKLSFNAYSSATITPATDVSVVLAGTNLLGVGSVANLTTANGLVVAGSSTNIHVTAPLGSNLVYTAFIQVNDGNGIAASATVKFDTINPAYTFEAEDWNYNGGQFIDNPQTNAYGAPNAPLDGTAEVDYHRPSGGIGGGYVRFGLQTEGASDQARVTHAGFQDYNIGFTTGGNWANYTRTYPAGTYNIFVRASRGDGGNIADAGKFSIVTSDRTQMNQTIQDLGKHSTPSTGGWQTYSWRPILNNASAPARFVSDGSVQTLRYTEDGAGDNFNFFMLLPADLSVNPPPFISTFTPDGTALFQTSNKVTFVVNSSVGIAQSNVVLNLNGVNVSGLTFSGSSTLWNVSYPVKTNGLYTAIITLTDTAGTNSTTNTFGTFDANNYQWEAEDYNHDNGQFTDNPQVDAYNGLGSTPDVDNHQVNLGGNPFQYRLNSPSPSTGTGDVGGELPRANFTSGGGSGIDYSIGYFGHNSWLNYTRHYPAGTYYVMGRFAEGNNPTEDMLSLVTGDVTTTSQTTTVLGTFPIAVHGWSSWAWSPLVDGGGKQVKVTLDGSATTLQLGGTPVVGHDEANVGFLMLVPTLPDITLMVTASGGNIHISFATQTGATYQVQYKNNLTDANWTSLGSPISGNGSIQTVNDPTTGNNRFYRVQY